jgi:hypothetical protein
MDSNTMKFLKSKTNKDMLIGLYDKLVYVEKVTYANTAMLAAIITGLKLDFDSIDLSALKKKSRLYQGLIAEMDADDFLTEVLLLINRKIDHD